MNPVPLPQYDTYYDTYYCLFNSPRPPASRAKISFSLSALTIDSIYNIYIVAYYVPGTGVRKMKICGLYSQESVLMLVSLSGVPIYHFPLSELLFILQCPDKCYLFCDTFSNFFLWGLSLAPVALNHDYLLWKRPIIVSKGLIRVDSLNFSPRSELSEQRHFTASLAVSCGQVTKFYAMWCERTWGRQLPERNCEKKGYGRLSHYLHPSDWSRVIL